MKNKLMGWQPEHSDNRLSFLIGSIVGFIQYWLNIQLPTDFPSKLLEGVITAGLAGFAGMGGKWLFEITKKHLTEYFKDRKNKTQ
jgi:hypothetical protein